MTNQLWAALEEKAQEVAGGSELVLGSLRRHFLMTQQGYELQGMTESMYSDWLVLEATIDSDDPQDYEVRVKPFVEQWLDDNEGILI